MGSFGTVIARTSLDDALPPSRQEPAPVHTRRPTAEPKHAIGISRGAAERVLDLYASGAVAVSDRRSVGEQLEELLAAVERALGNGDEGGLPSGPLDRLQLLRSLRTEILRGWPEDQVGLLELMRALETVQEALPEARHDAAMGASLTPFARELLYEVAHMLRSPLGSIVMLTEMLRDQILGPLTEAQARQVEIIHRAALGITCTANDILTLAHDPDRVDGTESFAVGDLLQTVGDVLRPVAESKGHSITVRSDVDGRRRGPRAALLEVVTSLGLRAALEGNGDDLELAAVDEGGDAVRFVIRTRRGDEAQATEERGPDRVALEVFRVDRETRRFTLSSQAMGAAAAQKVLERLDSTLERDGVQGPRCLSFLVELPPA